MSFCVGPGEKCCIHQCSSSGTKLWLAGRQPGMFRMSSPAFMKSLYAGGGASGACTLTFFTKRGGAEVSALHRQDYSRRPEPGSGSRLLVSCTAETARASKNHGKGWRVQSTPFRNFYSKCRTSPVQRLNQRFGASTMVFALNQSAAVASDEASSSDEDMDMDKFVHVTHKMADAAGQISRQLFRTKIDIVDNDDASDGNDDQFHLDSMVDEVENIEEELDEELAALTSGLTGNLPVASNSVWLGIDPDLSGAIAILKSQDNGTVAEVIDVPCITVTVNKRMRRRHDYQSIAAIVKKLQAPEGSIAYVEQARPFPKDGKQGWYITGYGYGVWLGILAAAGFTIVPVQARAWKSAMGLCGKEFTKDDSRALASSMFPLLSAQLRRKKDHGRAEALLIAAFGKGMTVTSLDEQCSPDRTESPNQPVPLSTNLSSQDPPFEMSTTRISRNTPLQ